MAKGEKIIYQGAVFNPSSMTTGIPDLLVRSDIINDIFNKNILDDKEKSIGCTYSSKWHYRVIDIKFAKLHLLSDGKYMPNTKKTLTYKSQVIIYNFGLGYMQNYLPEECYILGRKWSFVLKSELQSGNDCFDRLGHINIKKNDLKIVKKSKLAIEWIQNLRENGDKWNLSPPSVRELYPNMSNHEDEYPWSNAKKEIGQKLYELTMLWNIGPMQRINAHRTGVFQWNDYNCNSNMLNVHGKRARIVDKIIDINRLENQTIIQPRKIKNRDNIIRIKQEDIEFVVDFETVSDIDEDFNTNSVDSSIIFMIGCLTTYKINNVQYAKEFVSFTSKNISHEEEFKILIDWIKYMNSFNQFFQNKSPKIYHWSNAEPVIYRHVQKKYKMHNFPELNFTDLLKVFQEEPIVVKNSFSYGLKEISKCLYEHGIIKTTWDNTILDGKDAMIYALTCNSNNPENFNTSNIILHIEKYNYVDCKVIDEILEHLRKIC